MTFFTRARAFRTALGVTATAVAMATAGTVGTAAAAGNPADAGSAATRAGDRAAQAAGAPQGAFAAPRAAAPATAPSFLLWATDARTGYLSFYAPDGNGGLRPRLDTFVNYGFATAVAQVDNDKDGVRDGFWTVVNDGRLLFTDKDAAGESQSRDIGKGWQTYRKVLSPGNIGGGAASDLIAVDKAGVLWLYTAYADGRVSPRVRIGAGWGDFTEIAGQDDLTGDGKADIVARDKAGALWLYPGTGSYKAPFGARKKVGAGWNTYNRVLSIGDLDSDGRTDLLARTKSGDLYRYSGTGNATTPFKKAVKIGFGYGGLNLL
ncbi:FG-GAP repeat domain-containing protein [Streptomyces sp. NPDC002073]